MSLRNLAAGALLLAACAEQPIGPLVPTHLEVAQTPAPVQLPGAVIDTISVRLLDAQGRGVAGWPVTWSGDGTLEPLDSVTDVAGLARARWVLPRYDLLSPQFHTAGPSGTFSAHADAIGVTTLGISVEARAFRVDRVDAAFHYACGLRSGQLWCWGTVPRPVGLPSGVRVPQSVSLPAGVTATALRVTEQVACILDQGGTPWCATNASPGTFLGVGGAPPLDAIDGAPGQGFSIEGAFFCGRTKAEHRAWCWTYTADGTAHGNDVGTLAWTSVVAGRGFACGLDDQQVAWCWGLNEYGQLGDGTTQDRAIPLPVADATRFERLTANEIGVCGSAVDHKVYCWGRGYFHPETHVPTMVHATSIVGPDITLGGTGELYAIVGGDLRTWFNDEDLPIFMNIDRVDVAQVSGDGQSCIRARDGQVFCSWILLYGGGDTSAFTADVVPVPDPASVQD